MAGRFALDVSAWVKKAKGNGRLVVKKVVLDLGTSVVLKTPVGDPENWKHPAPAGYVGGRARGSWQYEKGAPAQQEPGTIDQSGQVAIARVAAGVQSGDAADQHFITSNVPYMRRLEYDAWSRQAPDGMVRLTVEEFRTHLGQAVRELP